jgi:hypothetical protein
MSSHGIADGRSPQRLDQRKQDGTAMCFSSVDAESVLEPHREREGPVAGEEHQRLVDGGAVRTHGREWEPAKASEIDQGLCVPGDPLDSGAGEALGDEIRHLVEHRSGRHAEPVDVDAPG